MVVAAKASACRHGVALLCASDSFRQSFAATAVITAAALALMPTMQSKARCACLAWLLPLAEAINECVETVVDRISKQSHPLSRDAKDLGSCLLPLASLPLLTAVALSVPVAASKPADQAVVARGIAGGISGWACLLYVLRRRVAAASMKLRWCTSESSDALPSSCHTQCIAPVATSVQVVVVGYSAEDGIGEEGACW